MANSKDALWLPVLPELSGFGGALTKGIAKQAEKAGQNSGSRFGKALGISAAAVAGIAAAGTAFYQVGKTFDEMSDTIAISSGATGDELQGLVDSAKTVGTQVPGEFNTIGDVLATLNTLTGETGEHLEGMTGKVMEASRMLGEDASSNAEKFGSVMQQWQIPAEEGEEKLDALFKSTQDYGMSLEGVMGHLNTYGPVLQNAGFNMEESATLFGQLEAGGIAVSRVMPGLNASFRRWAGEGKNSREELEKNVDAIRETEDSQEALAIATDVFGAEGAQRLTTAIRNGTLELDDLSGALDGSAGSIDSAAEETMSFAEQWELFKNNILVAIEPVATRVFESLSDGMENLVGWVQDDMIPAFERLVDWFDRASTWLVPLVAGIAGFAGAVIAVNTAMGIWSSITKAARGIQMAFNAVMAANPIMLVVTAIAALAAGLIWFFTQTEIGQELWAGFTSMLGDAWDWVVEKVGGAATWLWEKALEPFFTWVSDTWDTVWGWISEVWDTKGQPIWDAIYNAAMWIWEEALLPFFGWLGDAWGKLMGWLGEAWSTWGAAAWSAIETAALWLWEKVLEPIFSWIGDYWGLILTGMQLYWENVLKPVWNAIVAVATWLWEKVLEPIFSWIGDHWEEILFAMKYTWENYLLPAWERMKAVGTWLWEKLSDIFGWISEKWTWMKDTVVDVYETHIKPVFDKFGDIVSNLKDKFKSGVDNIKKQWDRLKSIAAKPVKFVIEDIFNDGLINALNKVPGVNIPDIPMPKWANEYASGGWTGPGSKYTPAGVVHADEYVLNKEATNSLRRQVGLAGLDYMNRHGRFPGYDTGGLVQPVNGPLTSRYGRRWGGMHSGVDWAVPVGTPVLAALAGTVVKAAWNAVTGRTGMGMLLAHSGNRNTYYGHLSAFRKNEGDQVAAGETIGLSGNTGNSTGPHLHFETWTGGSPVNPLGAMGGLPTSADGGSGWFDPLAPIRAIGEKITGWLTGKFPEAEFMVDAAVGLAKDGFEQVMSWAQSILPGHSDTGTGVSGAGMGAGSAATREAVRGVAEQYGWHQGAQWNALSELIQRESSWNVNAANPSSSARGLFQKMTSIHGPVASTAAGQAGWGLDYIKSRHTNPISALAFHDRNNWYADGGLVKDALFRDQGGNLPPGLSMVLNNTGRDEAILNDRQWQDIHTLAQRGSGGPGVNIENAYALSTEALARDIETSRRRAAALAPVL